MVHVMANVIRRCRTCGEPEDGGDFGWFDTDDGLYCNQCGQDPRRRPRATDTTKTDTTTTTKGKKPE
jgi:hypothetical protein